jgi:hypothetical protein
MARIDSTQTISKELAGDLEILPVFKELMQASTDRDSLYIKAKDNWNFSYLVIKNFIFFPTQS